MSMFLISFLPSARVAKDKVKEMLGGDGKEKDETGGMGDLFPSSGEGEKEKEGGGLFGGLVSSDKDSGGASKDSGGRKTGFLRQKSLQLPMACEVLMPEAL